jgi:hypothetical protein
MPENARNDMEHKVSCRVIAHRVTSVSFWRQKEESLPLRVPRKYGEERPYEEAQSQQRKQLE